MKTPRHSRAESRIAPSDAAGFLRRAASGIGYCLRLFFTVTVVTLVGGTLFRRVLAKGGEIGGPAAWPTVFLREWHQDVGPLARHWPLATSHCLQNSWNLVIGID